jgi:hypothetical protein
MCVRMAFAAAFILLPAALSVPHALAADPLKSITSVDVDLPFGDRMFEGQGSDAINNNCLSCHSAGMVLNQPPLPREEWEAEVHKMRQAYKAPVPDEDVTPIVDYLMRIKGAQ